MMGRQQDQKKDLSRRDFVKKTAAVGAAGFSVGLMAFGNFAYAEGSATMRIGLIGCGGRGTGAAVDAVNSSSGVEIAAMGDLFEDRLTESRNLLREHIGNKLTATDNECFVGFDAYEKVIDTDVDYVILATPPGYRPIHIKAAVEAGKHVFAEKPVAVDSVGVRSVIASSDLAEQKGLSIVAGTQNRHDLGYIETVKRIHDGAIGEVAAVQLVRSTGPLWLRERKPGMSDMEWQCRNWYYFTWLSGDGIVEMQIHSIDVANWVLQAHPVKAVGVGGRQVRVDPSYGHIFDHFGVDYEYPDGVHVMAIHRQQEGTSNHMTKHIKGAKGTSDAAGRIEGENAWSYEGDAPNAYVQEHADLIASIRSGEPLNEGRRIAESTLTAIMGREVAYTGQDITWEEVLKADLDLVPKTFEFGPAPFPPVPVPGKTKLNRTRKAYAATNSG